MYYLYLLVTDHKPDHNEISNIMEPFRNYFDHTGKMIGCAFEDETPEAQKCYNNELNSFSKLYTFEDGTQQCVSQDVTISSPSIVSINLIPFVDFYKSFDHFATVGFELTKCGPNGEYGYYYNPKAIFDRFIVGGKWADLLKLKNADSDGFTYTTCGFKHEIDFESMLNEDIMHINCLYNKIEEVLNKNPSKPTPFDKIAGENISTRWEEYTRQPLIRLLRKLCFEEQHNLIEMFHINAENPRQKALEMAVPFIPHGVIQKNNVGDYEVMRNESDDFMELVRWTKQFKDILDSIRDDQYLTLLDCHI